MRLHFLQYDIKYDVNKKRIEHYCQYQGLLVTWSFAHDTPNHAEFQSRPYSHRDKEKWIHYHDKILKEHLFEEELKWVRGIDFQMGVYQAVNVGDTLHHALELQLFGARKRKLRKAAKMKRWLHQSA